MNAPTAEDLIAAHALVGCEAEAEEVDVCPWEGVVEVQYYNAAGPKWDMCRSHAAPFRSDDAVRDSGRPNRKLLEKGATFGFEQREYLRQRINEWGHQG